MGYFIAFGQAHAVQDEVELTLRDAACVREALLLSTWYKALARQFLWKVFVDTVIDLAPRLYVGKVWRVAMRQSRISTGPATIGKFIGRRGQLFMRRWRGILRAGGWKRSVPLGWPAVDGVSELQSRERHREARHVAELPEGAKGHKLLRKSKWHQQQRG